MTTLRAVLEASPAPPRRLVLKAWHAPAASTAILLAAVAAARAMPAPGAYTPALLTLALLLLTLDVIAQVVWENRRWGAPVRVLTEGVRGLAGGSARFDPPDAPALDELVEAIDALRFRMGRGLAPAQAPVCDESWLGPWETSAAQRTPPPPALTRSGLFEIPPPAPASPPVGLDPNASGDFSTIDMVSRLEPGGLRWLESTQAEQEFLGWPLAELRRRSFPDIVHPDDRDLARDQLQAAVVKGEAHGLIYRVRTARGEMKAVEMNVSVRYGPNLAAVHLRCHVTDVTAKVKATRELRRRTRELIRANEQLRGANRELQELRDRYGDLYQNAPAMYFGLDAAGRLTECNDTLLRTLGHNREALIGRPYASILTPSRVNAFEASFVEFLRVGYIELESQWRKAEGTPIDVWVTATIVNAPDGSGRVSRGVAQDVTARRVLEAELREKNDRLARANGELSRKNRELDEFTYVVSHDLKEPVRTLIAFSDFLQRDCGDTLNEDGREYVQHLVDASRRMRALIHDLLNLSRAGRVTADFATVDLGEVIATLKADFAELIRTKAGDVRITGTLPAVWGDRVRIGQLFGNLLTNGLKYQRGPSPTVEVGALPEDSRDWATLYVKDDGIGIDPRFHAKIFQLFRRLHTRDEYEGTGAGLAICQKIVQAHGGRIWVESTPGEGSTFFLTLPLRPAALETSPPSLRTELLHDP